MTVKEHKTLECFFNGSEQNILYDACSVLEEAADVIHAMYDEDVEITDGSEKDGNIDFMKIASVLHNLRLAGFRVSPKLKSTRV